MKEPELRSFFKVFSLSPRDLKRKVIFSLTLRVCLNFLDVAAMVLIAFVAISVSNFSESVSKPSGNLAASFGEIRVDEYSILGFALVIVLLFLSKSLLSLWATRRMGKEFAEIEIYFSRILMNGQFNIERSSQPKPQSAGEFQNLLLVSLRSLVTEQMTGFSTFIGEASLIVVISISLFVVNGIAASLLFILLFGVFLVLTRRVGRKIQSTTKASYEASDALSIGIRDFSSVSREVHLNDTAQSWIDRLMSLKVKIVDASVQTLFYSGVPRHVIENALILGLVFFLGGIILVSDLQTQAVTMAVFLSGGLRLVASLIPLQNSLTLIRQASENGSSALATILSLQDARPQNSKNTINSTLDPELLDDAFVLRKVSYFSEDGSAIIQNLDLEIEVGTRLAIVGPSGAGKTKLVEIMMGLSGFAGGEVLANASHRRYAYLPQRTELVAGSLIANITLDFESGTVDLQKIQSLIDRVGLRGCVDRFKEGLSTEITPETSGLSGGELQRIGLIRALYHEPQVLFLDEYSSALDAETESTLISLIDEISRGLTLVVIAHRLKTVENFENILFLKKGGKFAKGTFNKLLSDDKDFQSFFRSYQG